MQHSISLAPPPKLPRQPPIPTLRNRIHALRIRQGSLNLLPVLLPPHASSYRTQKTRRTPRPTNPYPPTLALQRRRPPQDRLQPLRQQKRPIHIRDELQIKTLLRSRPLRREHHPGIVVQPVQRALALAASDLVVPSREFGDGGLDTGEIAEVDVEKMDLSLGVGVGGLQLFDRGRRFGLGAARDPDGGVVGVQQGGDFETETGVWSGGEGGLVMVGQG